MNNCSDCTDLCSGELWNRVFFADTLVDACWLWSVWCFWLYQVSVSMIISSWGSCPSPTWCSQCCGSYLSGSKRDWREEIRGWFVLRLIWSAKVTLGKIQPCMLVGFTWKGNIYEAFDQQGLRIHFSFHPSELIFTFLPVLDIVLWPGPLATCRESIRCRPQLGPPVPSSKLPSYPWDRSQR